MFFIHREFFSHEETLKCDSRSGCTALMKLTESGRCVLFPNLFVSYHLNLSALHRVYGGNYEDYVISQIELLIEKAEKVWDKSKSVSNWLPV